MPLCVRLCVCALVSLCISRDALYCNSFWQSCPTRGKTCVSPFLRRHKNSEPKYAYEWFMGSLKTIPETWTHTLPFLTQTHTHTHTHLEMERQQRALPVGSCLSGITNSLLSKIVLVISRTWLFFYPVCLFESPKRINLHGSQRDIRLSTRCLYVEFGREDSDSLGKNGLRRFQFVRLPQLWKQG